MFSAQLTTLLYRSTNWNIPVSTRECLTLTDFWNILYFPTVLERISVYNMKVGDNSIFRNALEPQVGNYP
jgi:hypothetical protein